MAILAVDESLPIFLVTGGKPIYDCILTYLAAAGRGSTSYEPPKVGKMP
jgi:hypothetical protein